MTTTTALGSTSDSKSLVGRLVGVVFAPRATYGYVAMRPQWFGALAITAALTAAGASGFMSTEVGRQAWVDAAVRQQEAFGRTLTDQQYARLEQMATYAPYFGAASIIALPLVAAVLSAVLLGVFNALAGGDAGFKQVFAIVSHSAAVLPVAQVIALPVAYARETLSGVTNLMVFFPFLDDTSFAAHFLGAIDLVYVWWIVSVSIGLGVLYRRRTGPIAAALLAVYAVIALAIAVARTAMSGA